MDLNVAPVDDSVYTINDCALQISHHKVKAVNILARFA